MLRAFKWLNDQVCLTASGFTSSHQFHPSWPLILRKYPTDRSLLLTYTIRDLQHTTACWKATGKEVRVKMQVSCSSDLGSHVQRHVTLCPVLCEHAAGASYELPPVSAFILLCCIHKLSHHFPGVLCLSPQDSVSCQCTGQEVPTSSPLPILAQTRGAAAGGAALPAPPHKLQSLVLGCLFPRVFFFTWE